MDIEAYIVAVAMDSVSKFLYLFGMVGISVVI